MQVPVPTPKNIHFPAKIFQSALNLTFDEHLGSRGMKRDTKH